MIYLHVGQAGNEIGSAFWRLAASEGPPRNWLFDERGRCRAVLVDTEPKVVHGAVRAVGAERFHPQCVLAEQSGRGNNWAAGFYGPTVAEAGPGQIGLRGSCATGAGGGAVCDAALEALRWQWERADGCAGVVLAHSLGGGTGSGLGSRLLLELRDRHPKHHLLSACAAPFGPGELPLAAYNAMLALASLHETADGVFYFDNAGLMRSLAGAAGGKGGAKADVGRGGGGAAGGGAGRGGGGVGLGSTGRLCLRHLDAHIASCLAGLTFPIDTAGGPTAAGRSGTCGDFGFGGFACASAGSRNESFPLRTRPFNPGVVSTDLAPLPRLKLLSLYTARGPNATPLPAAGPGVAAARSGAGGVRPPVSWGALVEEVLEQAPRYDEHHRPVTSLASVAIGRGTGADPPDSRARARLSRQMGISPATGDEAVRWTLAASHLCALPACGAPRTLTLASNRTAPAVQVDQLRLRAQLMLSVRAYVHHYETFGVSAQDILQAVDEVRDVVTDYNDLSRTLGTARLLQPAGQAGALPSHQSHVL